MSASAVVFYIISVAILVSALLAVTSGNIFRSAIWLLFSLTGIAGLYFWLQVEFVAAVQIVVYVGGIVVLIIFSIFLTQQSGKDLPAPARSRKIFAALAACAGFVLTCAVVTRHDLTGELGLARAAAAQKVVGSVGDIGSQLLSTSEHGYVLPFEVISVLLLAAMVGCIVIAIRPKPEGK
jgi:NADH-quinone oxidoreductase subunit J